MSPSEFLEVYPEFKNAGNLIASHLAKAALSVDPTVFGAKTDHAIYALAGHLLAESPWGRTLKKPDTKEGELDKYEKDFARLRRECVVPFVTT